jgi:hypothetical protein
MLPVVGGLSLLVIRAGYPDAMVHVHGRYHMIMIEDRGSQSQSPGRGGEGARRLTARQLSEKEQNSSVRRRQPVHCPLARNGA